MANTKPGQLVHYLRISGLVALILFLLTGCGGDWENATSTGSGADAPLEDAALAATEPVPADEEEEEEEEDEEDEEDGANEHAGTYKGSTKLKITVLEETSEGTRSITITISDSGSVKISGSDGSVGGTLSGDKITARIPVEESDSGVTCSGALPLSGTVSGNTISGSISGTLSCEFDDPLDPDPGTFPGKVTGSFSASK